MNNLLCWNRNRYSLGLFMDGYSGKRGVGDLMAPRKRYNGVLNDADNEKNQSARYCNRIGCSGRSKYTLNTDVGSSAKAKWPHPSFHSSNGNERTRDSCCSNPLMTCASKPCLDSKRMLSSQLELDISESSLSSESEVPVAPPRRSPTEYHSESMKKPGKLTGTEVGSSSKSLNIGPQKLFQCKSGSHNQNTVPGSSISSVSKCSTQGPFNASKGSRYGLKNLKCNTISDVVPPNCSSSESKTTGKNVMKKQSQEGESSLSNRRKRTTAGSPLDQDVTPSTSCISISDSRCSSSASGEDTNAAASVRTRRSTNVNTSMRLSNQQNGSGGSSFREHSFGISEIPDDEIPFNLGGQSPLQLFSSNITSSSSGSYSLSSSNDNDPSTVFPFTSAELGFTHLRRSLSEVLLALEGFEQNEELTHEQVLALETSLFLSGLNLYDHHRDMRLDIDNMSYEELLALEEKIGTVSTGLSKEAPSNCLRRGTYQATLSEVRVTGLSEDGDVIKCCICQEEYVNGDEIGKLAKCQHEYHEPCITQWLRLKNWCPICKVAAAPKSCPP